MNFLLRLLTDSTLYFINNCACEHHLSVRNFFKPLMIGNITIRTYMTERFIYSKGLNNFLPINDNTIIIDKVYLSTSY